MTMARTSSAQDAAFRRTALLSGTALGCGWFVVMVAFVALGTDRFLPAWALPLALAALLMATIYRSATVRAFRDGWQSEECWMFYQGSDAVQNRLDRALPRWFYEPTEKAADRLSYRRRFGNDVVYPALEVAWEGDEVRVRGPRSLVRVAQRVMVRDGAAMPAAAAPEA